jgi:thiamine biosynthesis lipoprotein
MKRRLFVATPLLLSGELGPRRWELLSGARAAQPGIDPPVERVAGTAFGTIVSLCALREGGVDTQAALHRAMREVQRIDALLSLYRPDSQLSLLNRTGRLDQADPHVLRNLEFAAQLALLTDGAFDITVQPLWELFAAARAAGTLPGAAAIAATRRRVDHRAVRLQGSTVRLAHPEARVTLNSLAQGYAADVVLAMLREDGVDAALVDTGEIGNLGRRAPARPWTVGVQHPREHGALFARVGMDGRVVSTSGDYATSFSSDFRYHHIFDPATGVSPRRFSSTIALARSGLVADGLSTAMMVLDRGAGERLLRSFAGADGLWIDKQGDASATAGVPFA